MSDCEHRCRVGECVDCLTFERDALSAEVERLRRAFCSTHGPRLNDGKPCACLDCWALDNDGAAETTAAIVAVRAALAGKESGK